MIENIPLDSRESHLAAEWSRILRSEYMTGEGLVLMRQERGRLLVWIGMGAATEKMGLMLATLSRPDELGVPGSLSRRMAPGDTDRPPPDSWVWRLYPTRFPSDHSIGFSLKIWVPYSDLPEVVARLGGNPAARG